MESETVSPESDPDETVTLAYVMQCGSRVNGCLLDMPLDKIGALLARVKRIVTRQN